MKTANSKNEKEIIAERPPVVAIMGHIDHGKSTLLDYIRKTSLTEKEAGGITQHLGAYEVRYESSKGSTHPITFLDTPGHEAFKGIRSRGASTADIAVLIVSGEEGVKPQTLEALSFIKQRKIPYIVAITKIDRPGADVERTKQSLAEKEIYVEGYGGDIPCIPVSSKTGEGITDLIEMILLVAEMHPVQAGPSPFEAYVIESSVNKIKGISATVIIRAGTLSKGMFLVAEDAWSPTRRIEDVEGRAEEEVRAGRPARIIGWSKVPPVGALLRSVQNKREAEELVLRESESQKKKRSPNASTEERVQVPLIIKADVGGSLEAIEQEILKRSTEKALLRVIHRGIGTLSEGDVKVASGATNPLIIGFNVDTDPMAKAILERNAYEVGFFDIIYKLSDWLDEKIRTRIPKEKVEEIRGNAKVLKVFNTEKDKQIVGGRVLDGELHVGNQFKIWRRDALIGEGKFRELQKFKEKTETVLKDSEFGAFVNSSIEIMPGDRLEAFEIVEK